MVLSVEAFLLAKIPPAYQPFSLEAAKESLARTPRHSLQYGTDSYSKNLDAISAEIERGEGFGFGLFRARDLQSSDGLRGPRPLGTIIDGLRELVLVGALSSPVHEPDAHASRRGARKEYALTAPGARAVSAYLEGGQRVPGENGELYPVFGRDEYLVAHAIMGEVVERLDAERGRADARPFEESLRDAWSDARRGPAVGVRELHTLEMGLENARPALVSLLNQGLITIYESRDGPDDDEVRPTFDGLRALQANLHLF